MAVRSARAFPSSVYRGEGDALDFTALGDTVNTVPGRIAKTGEIVLSHATAVALTRRARTAQGRGREQTVDAWVQPAMSSVETTAA